MVSFFYFFEKNHEFKVDATTISNPPIAALCFMTLKRLNLNSIPFLHGVCQMFSNIGLYLTHGAFHFVDIFHFVEVH